MTILSGYSKFRSEIVRADAKYVQTLYRRNIVYAIKCSEVFDGYQDESCLVHDFYHFGLRPIAILKMRQPANDGALPDRGKLAIGDNFFNVSRTADSGRSHSQCAAIQYPRNIL